ncbi:hypothetical protein EV191_1011367 [Tamaricihabitans halophyticus]|uniref:Type VII secretion system (Wss) protein ESAT-6 n=1 Tax=Tamaricihabitans halophyticus TaxID=1262583 RepID=A0A4R2R3K5_9PSEU|nr:hypothetical protein [Tamaricihabitans halophyticus]TCP57412.1 hypothetical protein EV191_1011367 [Tamaricihabitans halophyticus]
MSENPLIAEEKAPSATKGAGVVDSVASTVDSISNGNWAEGLLGGAGAVVGAAGMMADPLGELAKAGVGWLIEHVEFLKEPMDALVGDQEAIAAMSETWTNVSTEVQGAAEDLRTAVSTDTARFVGQAAEAYRPFAEDQANHIGGVSTAADGAAQMVSMCGVVLGVVRQIVIDLIGQAVAELIEAALRWAAAMGLTLGLATPGMIGDLVRIALKWADDISEWVERITKAFKQADGLMARLLEGVEKVKTKLDDFAQGIQKVTKPFGDDITIKRPGMSDTGKWQGSVDPRALAGNTAVGEAQKQTAQGIDDTYNPDEEQQASEKSG